MEFRRVVADQIIHAAGQRLERMHGRMRVRAHHPDSHRRLDQPIRLRLARRIHLGGEGGALMKPTADHREHGAAIGQEQRVAARLRKKAHTRIVCPTLRSK